MSETLDRKPNKTGKLGTRLKVGGAVAVAAVSGAVLGHRNAGASERADVAGTAATDITTDIALGHSSDVVENGKAVISMQDGERVVISKPILKTEWDANQDKEVGTAVAARTRGSDTGELSAVTTYVAGEDGVTDVSVVENGKTMTPEQADLNNDVSEVELTRSSGLSGDDTASQPDFNGDRAGYFKPVNGQSAENPNEHIAQVTEDSVVTTSK